MRRTWPFLPGKSNAVQPYSNVSWVSSQGYVTELTSISRTGPVVFNLFLGFTGTASNVSSLSPPSLCYHTVVNLIRDIQGADLLTLSTASIRTSMPQAFAAATAASSSSLDPQRVGTVPF